MLQTKIFAAYLPQFYETEDNNNFWGKGYTEWVAVKNAKPQFPNHIQPKIPYNNNYYDLSKKENIIWQANLAKKYGVDGFNIYHYWFKNGKKELEIPPEIILNNKDIDINFYFTWDNTSWVRSWSNIKGTDFKPSEDNNHTGKKILVEYDIGNNKDWEEHFYYLLPFFKDKRYLKIDNKPVFAIMDSDKPDKIREMCDFWKKLAISNGLKGLYLINHVKRFCNPLDLDGKFVYEPPTSVWGFKTGLINRLCYKYKINLKFLINKLNKYDYAYAWKKVLKRFPNEENVIPGCFVKYDDSPRRGSKSNIIINASPEKFEKYFREFYIKCCRKDKPFLYITAWNEWGEGSNLEPDTIDEFSYLKALKNAKESVLNDFKIN